MSHFPFESFSFFPMPALLPEELSYKNVSSDKELFVLLSDKLSDFISFFEYACADETWSGTHSEFMTQSICWLTDQEFQDKFNKEWTERIAKSIQEHFGNLASFIPFNIKCQLEDGNCEINSLLFSAASHFFKDILRRECLEKNENTLAFKVSIYRFKFIEEYVNTGIITSLWKLEQEEVVTLLQLAASWGLNQVVALCEDTLQRYLTNDNVLDMLVIAHREHWPRFKEECMRYVNHLDLDFNLFSESIETVSFEFRKFSERSLEYFKKLTSYITELIISGHLTEDPHFNEVVSACSKLKSLNISGSNSFNENLFNIPKKLESLNISQCGWLNHQTLKKLWEICPSLKKIVLASNTQLNFVAWGELSKFKSLESLDLSRCHQINDEDFSIILRACRNIKELILDECKKISDKGYFELSKVTSKVMQLDLSRCSLTDLSLIEIALHCHQLTILNLSRCENVTEKGLFNLLKYANKLRSLVLIKTNISESMIDKLKSENCFVDLKNN